MTTPTAPTTLTHRPAGIGHPYAASADQRLPVHPGVGERVSLGVVAADLPDGATVLCEWASGSEVVTLPCEIGRAHV